MADVLAELLVKLGLDGKNFAAGVEKTSKLTDNWNAKLMGVGASMTALITGPIAAFSLAAFKVGQDWDDAMDKISVKTGATGPELEGLATSFRNVFTSVPATAAQASDAISDLSVRLGLTGKPLEDLAAQMLHLARITGSELGPLVAASAKVFTGWSISTDQQAAAMDSLFRVSQKTGIGVSALAESVVQFGAPLRAMGLSLEEGAALLGGWEKSGVKVDTMMAGLRKAMGYFAAAGVEPRAALQAVIEKLRGTGSETEKTQLAMQVFGKKAFVYMLDAIQSGKFSFDALIKSIGGSGDTIAEAAKRTYDFAETWILFKNRVSAALEPMGKQLLDVLDRLVMSFDPVIAALGRAAEWFGKLTPAAQDTIFLFGAVAAAAGPVLVAMGGLSMALASVGPALGTLSGLMGAGGLATAFSVATPLAIAFGLAIAGWAVYEAVTTLRALNAELDRLYAAQARGAQASAGEADQIRALEGVLKSHNATVGAAKIAVDSTGLSVQQYIANLKEAVARVDKFNESFKTTTKVLADGTIVISGLGAAIASIVGGSAAAEQAAAALAIQMKELGVKSTAELREELDKAKDALKAVAEGMTAGTASYRDYAMVAKKVADIQKELEQSSTRLSQSFDDAGVTAESQLRKQLEKLRATLRTVLDALQAGKATWGDVTAVMKKHAEVAAEIDKRYEMPNLPVAIAFFERLLRLAPGVTGVLGKAGDGLADLNKILDWMGRVPKPFNIEDLWDVDKLKIPLHLPESVQRLETAYKELGKTSQSALWASARAAEEAYEELRRQGAPMKDLNDAWAVYIERAYEAQGITLRPQRNALQEISTILTDMSSEIARAIVAWKSFGNVVLSIVRSIGAAILREIIQKLILTESVLLKITKLFRWVLSKIPGLGGVVVKPPVSAPTGPGGVPGASGGTVSVKNMGDLTSRLDKLVTSVQAIGSNMVDLMAQLPTWFTTVQAGLLKIVTPPGAAVWNTQRNPIYVQVMGTIGGDTGGSGFMEMITGLPGIIPRAPGPIREMSTPRAVAESMRYSGGGMPSNVTINISETTNARATAAETIKLLRRYGVVPQTA